MNKLVFVGVVVCVLGGLLFGVNSNLKKAMAGNERIKNDQKIKRQDAQTARNEALVKTLEATVDKLVKTGFDGAFVDLANQRIYLEIGKIAEDRSLDGLDHLWHSLRVRLVRKDGVVSSHNLEPPCAFHAVARNDNPRFHVIMLNFGQAWVAEYQNLDLVVVKSLNDFGRQFVFKIEPDRNGRRVLKLQDVKEDRFVR